MKKLRINMILGKKHLITAGLALVLAVGLYANFAIANNVNASKQTAENYGDTRFVSADTSDTEKANTADTNADAQKSDAQIVSSQKTDTESTTTGSSEEYFAQARIDKKNSRAEAVETLKSMYTGGDATRDELAVVAQDAATMTNLMETETKIETILKAQGFEDALCYLSANTANIIVKTDGLDTAQAAQIKNALLSEVDVAGENITIVEVN